MENVALVVRAVDGDRIVLSDGEREYVTDRSSGDRDVFVRQKVIGVFNDNRLWFWVYWNGNAEIKSEDSSKLPDHFIGDVKGYTGDKCLVRVNKTHYLIPAYCRVPSGQYKFKVTCRYINTMRVSRWKVEKLFGATVPSDEAQKD